MKIFEIVLDRRGENVEKEKYLKNGKAVGDNQGTCVRNVRPIGRKMFKNCHKEDLRIVALEFGVTVAEKVTIVELTEIIKENKYFKEDAEFVKELIQYAIEDRKSLKSLPNGLTRNNPEKSASRRESNRFGGQGVGYNRRFDSRRRSGQSDHRFNNHGGRQGGSRNGAFRGQNGQDSTQNVVADVLSRNPVDNVEVSQISCAALRALALNSREQLIQEQREDPELRHIYRYLENPEDGSVTATVCEGWSQDFKLLDGLLFHAKKKYCTTLGELRVYIPQSLRGAIMNEFHDEPLAGHLGKKKTCLKLRDVFIFRI
ncbi:hypothetical protein TNCV_2304491 [Trichonephila clavipes]|nr:hypothetical protein TNCV_2304491 [Trichonephila clavipes]